MEAWFAQPSAAIVAMVAFGSGLTGGLAVVARRGLRSLWRFAGTIVAVMAIGQLAFPDGVPIYGYRCGAGCAGGANLMPLSVAIGVMVAAVSLSLLRRVAPAWLWIAGSCLAGSVAMMIFLQFWIT